MPHPQRPSNTRLGYGVWGLVALRGAEWGFRVVGFVYERIHPTVILESIMLKQSNALELPADRIALLVISKSVEGSYG